MECAGLNSGISVYELLGGKHLQAIYHFAFF